MTVAAAPAAALRRFSSMPPRVRRPAYAKDSRLAALGRATPPGLAAKHLDRRFMDARVAGRDDAAAVLRGLAFPGRDHAAGAGDDRYQRGDVIGLQFGLDDEVKMAGGEH